jgi:Protein of unknown function (DUF1488)
MSVEGQKEFQWDATANRLWFEVDQDGEPVRCCIDALCLYLAFGASTLAEADATNAYISRRGWIHTAALNKAGKGGFERDGDRAQAFVRLTARDL